MIWSFEHLGKCAESQSSSGMNIIINHSFFVVNGYFLDSSPVGEFCCCSTSDMNPTKENDLSVLILNPEGSMVVPS